jgi:general secretion pathway protein L
MTRLFKETFPETTRIVDPLVQMKSKLQDVQAPATATPIFSGDKRALNILADISGRVPESIEIHVSRLVIETDSVVIRGTTDAFNNVNLIQGVLRKSPAYSDVAIISASAEKDSGLIRFELKLRAAGTS